jgi:diguanylate cyclase (GGDEF)-like protein
MMQQTIFLNLVTLFFFVVLFYSIYRKRPSIRLRYWIQAWLCALAHFTLLLWQPASVRLDDVSSALSVTALLLCGVFFIASASILEGLRARTVSIAGVGLLLLSFVAGSTFLPGYQRVSALVGLSAQAVALVVFWRARHGRLTLVVPGTVAIFLCAQWSAWESLRSNPDGAFSVLLMELFGLYALLFAQEFARRSAGVLTATAGLLAWAAVFPASMALAALAPTVLVRPEIWNIPKVVVAFGMLMTLFEDEVLLAERDREQYRTLFDGNPLPMWILANGSLQLLEGNAAAIRDFGWTRAQTRELTLRDLAGDAAGYALLEELSLRLRPAVASHLRASDMARTHGAEVPAAASDTVQTASMLFQTRQGGRPYVEVTLQPVRFEDREAQLLIVKDISAQRAEQEELLHRVNHDALTGLPNRLLLKDRMQTALAAAERHGTRIAVLCVDLDRFKQINDTHGHAAGDQCLREVGVRLKHRLRTVDTAARTGGEEFTIILDEIAERGDAEHVARELLATLRVPLRWNGTPIQLSASIGIAMFPEDSDDAAQLMNQADAAMYRAKQSGGNRHRFFSRGS